MSYYYNQGNLGFILISESSWLSPMESHNWLMHLHYTRGDVEKARGLIFDQLEKSAGNNEFAHYLLVSTFYFIFLHQRNCCYCACFMLEPITYHQVCHCPCRDGVFFCNSGRKPFPWSDCINSVLANVSIIIIITFVGALEKRQSN